MALAQVFDEDTPIQPCQRQEVDQALSNPEHPAAAITAAVGASGGILGGVTDDRVWTAAELERLTPDERHRVINEGIVSDLEQLAPAFRERVRAKGRALLKERGQVAPQSDGG